MIRILWDQVRCPGAHCSSHGEWLNCFRLQQTSASSLEGKTGTIVTRRRRRQIFSPGLITECHGRPCRKRIFSSTHSHQYRRLRFSSFCTVSLELSLIFSSRRKHCPNLKFIYTVFCILPVKRSLSPSISFYSHDYIKYCVTLLLAGVGLKHILVF
jgi:hypothetical protein